MCLHLVSLSSKPLTDFYMFCITLINANIRVSGHMVTTVFACYLDTIMDYGQRLQDYLNI